MIQLINKLIFGPPQVCIFDEIKVRNRRIKMLTLGVICCIVFGNKGGDFHDFFIEDYKEELRLIKEYKSKMMRRNKSIEPFYIDREKSIEEMINEISN